jgi:quinol monooxygenase YgiN
MEAGRMNDAHVAWVFELTAKDGQGDALHPLMAEMVEATRAGEPGALDYEWHLSDDGTRVHLYERYADSAAALAHLATFGARFMARFFDVLTPGRVVLYGAPSAAVREALAGLAPTVMARAAGFSRHVAPADGVAAR